MKNKLELFLGLVVMVWGIWLLRQSNMLLIGWGGFNLFLGGWNLSYVVFENKRRQNNE